MQTHACCFSSPDFLLRERGGTIITATIICSEELVTFCSAVTAWQVAIPITGQKGAVFACYTRCVFVTIACRLVINVCI